MGDGGQSFFLDSFYVISYIYPQNSLERLAQTSVVNALKPTSINPDIMVKIPFVAIAEVIKKVYGLKPRSKKKVLKKGRVKKRRGFDKTKALQNLESLLKIESVDIIPAGYCCLSVAKELLEKDNYLDATDSLIIAQALCDPDSVYLLMRETTIIESRVIRDMNQEMFERGERNRLLRITDEL